MKSFSIVAILALAASTIASPVAQPNAEAAVELEKRADHFFTIWTDDGFRGAKWTKKNPVNGKCYELSSEFFHKVSSAGPSGSLVCSLWAKKDCTGNKVTIRFPGTSKLNSVNFNDDAEAYQCLY